jgi:hypothetical protein
VHIRLWYNRLIERPIKLRNALYHHQCLHGYTAPRLEITPYLNDQEIELCTTGQRNGGDRSDLHLHTEVGITHRPVPVNVDVKGGGG